MGEAGGARMRRTPWIVGRSLYFTAGATGDDGWLASRVGVSRLKMRGGSLQQRDKHDHHLGRCGGAILETHFGSHTRARSGRLLSDCSLAFGPEKHDHKGI